MNPNGQKPLKAAYCTGFWCTNIGNGFFGLGTEYVLKKVFGERQITVVSDLQTYTTSYGRRLYPHRYQYAYLSELDVDLLVLSGPVLSRYFLSLWKDILLSLQKRGVGYILVSCGTMKLDAEEAEEIRRFFRECPPYILTSRDRKTYEDFGSCAVHAYDGICFSFFVSDTYVPSPILGKDSYAVLNFDKILEPRIEIADGKENGKTAVFSFEGVRYSVKEKGLLRSVMKKTDGISDIITYLAGVFPSGKGPEKLGRFDIVRTDHRFYPHYRSKIYRHCHSYCADLPYGYLNLYAGAALTLSDRVHACAAALAFGGSAMLFADTKRAGLLDRVGASGVTEHPVRLDPAYLRSEKEKLLSFLTDAVSPENIAAFRRSRQA